MEIHQLYAQNLSLLAKVKRTILHLKDNEQLAIILVAQGITKSSHE
jgi:hypothetical protein